MHPLPSTPSTTLPLTPTLLIPLLFALGIVSAPPVAAGHEMTRTERALGASTGSTRQPLLVDFPRTTAAPPTIPRCIAEPLSVDTGTGSSAPDTARRPE
ncbi:hypothetical protein AB0B25_21580 [Nocardia sp. NPDC049190]|uniref:hypothetical protein n=1 Tax=Nocardia sp. NPDC049190 TaxID=3155650 RepID=UPI003402AE78